jgi:hypothetical protein
MAHAHMGQILRTKGEIVPIKTRGGGVVRLNTVDVGFLSAWQNQQESMQNWPHPTYTGG